MYSRISNGNILFSLSRNDPGKMSHSRWLTTANRNLRLYVSTKYPSENLKVLTEYVIRAYTCAWFDIKSKLSCRYGSQYFYNIIKNSRFLPEKLKNIEDQTLQRNAYFNHPEIIVLQMVVENTSKRRPPKSFKIYKCS